MGKFLDKKKLDQAEKGRQEGALITAYLRRSPSRVHRHLTVVFDAEMGIRITQWRHRLCNKHYGPDPKHPSDRKLPCRCVPQSVLASSLGITQQALSDIEKGKIKHSSLNYLQFKSVFQDRADYIITGVGIEKYQR